ncbi:hypothetical protein SAMN05421856_101388 [Chryseobacterium taichungense]|uniref:Uncharacterized protein n=1 Tax=Chryseobacterium taichungense TaxID=295069 RepID=A0A1H7W0A4_9FLAO|nr:hypothetical protein [Chryseobacterium taichungense]SEM14724.1 hypothetical protein SAMN05421856_101388 [Chryseobacterium taichungense]
MLKYRQLRRRILNLDWQNTEIFEEDLGTSIIMTLPNKGDQCYLAHRPKHFSHLMIALGLFTFRLVLWVKVLGLWVKFLGLLVKILNHLAKILGIFIKNLAKMKSDSFWQLSDFVLELGSSFPTFFITPIDPFKESNWK